MGWHINLVKNTVKIDSEIALALYNCEACVADCWKGECSFPMLEGIIDGGKLVFNDDHMEHMDYVEDTYVQEVLKRFRVAGDVCFSSNDGDNRGQKWGYRFDGEGGMTLLKGKDVFSEAPKKAKQAVKKDLLWSVKSVIENEGFDYGLRHYTDFKDVNDAKFQKLLKAYRKAADAMEEYLGD